ncbi:MAG: hypothetical protein ABIW46_05590 [Acidimicrobiales bacterium]
MTGREGIIGGLLAVVVSVMMAIGIMLLPFQAAGGLDCESPLKGAEPKEEATEGFLVGREEAACSRRSGSRVATGAIAGSLFLIIGLGSVLAPQSRIERALFGDEDVVELYEE